jgi:fructose-bisphosphate aldolase class I
MARYAALSQEAGIVPIVEPEELIDGDHTIEQCYDATQAILSSLFRELTLQRVELSGLLLKTSMVLAGKQAPQWPSPVADVARETVRCLRATIPPAVPGVVFLSGGQTETQASAHLDAMTRLGPQPWELSFSYARALQGPAMAAWKGDASNVEAGQKALYHRARLTSAARMGRYSPEMEDEAA